MANAEFASAFALMFLLSCHGLVAPTPMPSLPDRAERDTLFVEGSQLYDPCGERIVLRGVNKMNIWTDRDGSLSFPEIAQTGANAVRIVWTTEGTAAELDTVIANALRYRMIPMVELHDATGDLSRLPAMVDYWVQTNVLAVLRKHETFLLLNIANEPGDNTVGDAQFRAAYESAVDRLRKAGLTCPLVIDASSWGRDLDILLRNSEHLINFDSQHNLLFSVHMWWVGVSAEEIFTAVERAVVAEVPLIIGEFAGAFGTKGPIEYRAILEATQLYGIGWLAWSWGPGNLDGKVLDMTEDNSLTSLHGWGRDVALEHPKGIRGTSLRPHSLTHGSCKLTESSQPTGYEWYERRVSPADARIEYIGRFDRSDPERVSFSWPGSTVRTRFRGTNLRARLVATAEPTNLPSHRQRTYFDVIVDDQAPWMLGINAVVGDYQLASGLLPGEHTVTLVKRTEAVFGTAHFLGFVTGDRTELLPPKPAPRRIVFVGDSLTAGYGNEGEDETCGFTAETENARLSFGGIVGRLLGADSHLIAYSGRGVVRNWDRSTTVTYPDVFGRVLTLTPETLWPAETSGSKAMTDAVVVTLGGNDFSHGDPGPPYSQAYENLLAEIRRLYPMAFVFCNVMLRNEEVEGVVPQVLGRAYVQQAIARRNAAGDRHIILVENESHHEGEPLGCDWHPSVTSHRRIAASLAEAISKQLEW